MPQPPLPPPPHENCQWWQFRTEWFVTGAAEFQLMKMTTKQRSRSAEVPSLAAAFDASCSEKTQSRQRGPDFSANGRSEQRMYIEQYPAKTKRLVANTPGQKQIEVQKIEEHAMIAQDCIVE